MNTMIIMLTTTPTITIIMTTTTTVNTTINTVNNNAQSYRKKFGDEAVSATQYTASGNTPFFIKSITQQPQCPKPAYRPEAFTVCSITNPADTYRQNKTTQVVYRQEKAHKLFHK